MIDHDRLFKELLTTFFPDFIDLFFPDVGNFSKRMFRYFARLYEKHDLPVYPIALFSYDIPQRAEPTFHRADFPDFKVLEFNYRVIQLNRLNWRDFLRYQNPAASALMAKMKIAPCDRPRVKLECLRLMATLRLDRARMRLISGFVDTYLRLNAEEETLFRTEINTIEPSEGEEVMEIVTSWMEQGIEQGLQQGRQREASLILRLLNRRIGGIAPNLEARIRGLSVDKLEELGEALLDFSDVADLIAWFDREVTT
ncbi:DUF4351 domain-containing protein [Argonema antarcticum]|uniref:DUF4351 domain-containing protein n=1 Tax=Argonema antarcticum TaxID=2942763 RepID=UPI00201186AF|nr:DUF4351 domain-containing protein [Argonema antarcticum]MCL1473577.1 DUF4351 domain-containing protein [Argonema antarcticum A004/B2]